MEKFKEIACKQCQLLLRTNGVLERGRDVQRLKIREQAEEIQKQETQINLLTDQIEAMNEDKQSEICFDSGRDERDMVIADVLENEVYVVSSDKLRVDKLIKQLRGEK